MKYTPLPFWFFKDCEKEKGRSGKWPNHSLRIPSQISKSLGERKTWWMYSGIGKDMLSGCRHESVNPQDVPKQHLNVSQILTILLN